MSVTVPGRASRLADDEVDPAELAPFPGNPRRGNVDAIVASLAATGQYKRITVQASTGFILAGNHTWLGFRRIKEALGEALASGEPVATLAGELGMSEPAAAVLWDRRGDYDRIAVTRVDCDDTVAARIVVADNRTADLGTYDNAALMALLQQLEGEGYTGSGYDEGAVVDLAELLAGVTDVDEPPAGHDDGEAGEQIDPDEGWPGSDGSLLALVDVSVAEPSHQVHGGQVWQLGPHVLVVAEVMTGLAAWAPWMSEADIFLPYAGPYAALCQRAEEHAALLVQPDLYLAGHVLDKWASVKGEDTIKQLEAP